MTLDEVFWNFISSNKKFFKETWCWVLNVMFCELSRLGVNLTKEAVDMSRQGSCAQFTEGGPNARNLFPSFQNQYQFCLCLGSYMCLFQERETKKYEPKEKYQKKQDLDQEEKGRKEPKALKSE